MTERSKCQNSPPLICILLNDQSAYEDLPHSFNCSESDGRYMYSEVVQIFDLFAGSFAGNELGNTMSDGVSAGASSPSTSFFEPHLGDFENSVSVLNNSDHKSSDNSLLALERRVAEACALVERVLREREEREQFGRGIEVEQQLTEEQRARGGEEREERELRYTQRKDASDALTQNGM